jgi:Rap1a immunity proteins
MQSIAITLMILGALLSAAASADEPAMTAGDLEQLCAGSDHVSKNACRIYILGVTQGMNLGMNIADGKTPGGRPCVPPAISAEQLERTLTNKLAALDSAAERDREAAAFIGGVLARAFPCLKARH